MLLIVRFIYLCVVAVVFIVIAIIIIAVIIIVIVVFFQRILVVFPCISIFIYGFWLPTFVDIVVVATNRCFTFTFHSLHLTHFKRHINRGVGLVSSWVVSASVSFVLLRSHKYIHTCVGIYIHVAVVNICFYCCITTFICVRALIYNCSPDSYFCSDFNARNFFLFFLLN